MRKLSTRIGSYLLLAVVVYAQPAQAKPEIKPAPQSETKSKTPAEAKIDAVVRQVLADTGAPSASIAVVKRGQVIYTQAYGQGRLEPAVAARPAMRYGIGSVSKQFTAAAILLLAEQGALSLDDKVARFLPSLTRANEVSIRNLLSHTSGYQDYWPQDYIPPIMQQKASADEILDRWARKPLDFEPGKKWQYSNTNFLILGLIIEKASGLPYLRFLRQRVLGPLGLGGVVSLDQEHLADTDAAGYTRYALGPPRAAAREGQGWLYAIGELAMTAEELARWDLALLERRLLRPSSHVQMGTETLLASGQGARYGLGIGVGSESEHRVLSHGGEVSGFCAMNLVFPDDGAAIVVLVNLDRTQAADQISHKLVPLLFDVEDGSTAAKQDQARRIFEALQRGVLDRSLFTDNAKGFFSQQAMADFAASLRPLGAPLEFTQTAQRTRGGMIQRKYRVKFPKTTLLVWTREVADGRLEEYQVASDGS